jgi:magnesium transporter
MPIYAKTQSQDEKNILNLKHKLPNNIIWLDLFNVTDQEERTLEQCLNIDIPTFQETKDIPISNRLYEKDHSTYSTISLYLDNQDAKNHLDLYTITFILKNNLLITIRDDLSMFFYIESSLIHAKYSLVEKMHLRIFLILIESFINNSASLLENIAHNLNQQSTKLLGNTQKPNMQYKNLLTDVANIGNSLTLIQESITSFIRMIDFLAKTDQMNQSNEAFIKYIKVFTRDLGALKDQSSSLASKVSFLLDATLGLINIEQNNIIKLFSVISVISTPPILIASIYGMNFRSIPELNWPFGYSWALVLMFISAWLPYKYFKKKGWF